MINRIFVVFIFITFSAFAQLPPHRVMVVGASLSDRMGGDESTLPVLDLIIKTNESPGERVYLQLKEQYQDLYPELKFKFKKHTMFNTGSSYHHSWIKRKLPKNPETESYDLIFALDLFYKDIKDFALSFEDHALVSIDFNTAVYYGSLDANGRDEFYRENNLNHEMRQRYYFAARKAKKIQDRTYDILQRFARNGTRTWFSYAISSGGMKSSLGTESGSCRSAIQANEWVQGLLRNEEPDYPFEPQLASKISYLNLDKMYVALHDHGQITFMIDGLEYQVSADEILAKGNSVTGGKWWHPNPTGSKLLANYLMDQTSDWDLQVAFFDLPFEPSTLVAIDTQP